MLAPGMPSQRITVKTDLLPELPPVTGDRHALHGMLFNLVTNAVQAMPQGGEINIATTRVLSDAIAGTVVLEGTPALDAGVVRLTIRDTGHGIPPDHLSRVFDPFFTTRPREGGTGLGLAICRRVVSSSGGRLAVQSTIGHGTLFTIDLPTDPITRAGTSSAGEPDGR